MNQIAFCVDLAIIVCKRDLHTDSEARRGNACHFFPVEFEETLTCYSMYEDR